MKKLKHRNIWIFIVILVVAALVSGFVVSRHASAPAHKNKAQPSQTTEPSAEPSGKQPASFDKSQYSTTDPASPWVIVNKKHPLNPKNYAPGDLVAVGAGQYMRADAANALAKMLTDAKAAGYVVTPASGYRSYSTQVSVYTNEVKTYGKKVADSESARPGFSEHQTGLAMDLASGGCSITDCFGGTPGGKWITANAYKYGFLLRYPADKVAVTGYRSETWHFRYIGTALATEMHHSGTKTLEEFFNTSGGDYE